MGCDIHCYVERKNNNGNWEKVGNVFPVSEFERQFYDTDKRDSPFSWRNYDMFSVLAGVRNRGGITPISRRKGLPIDISNDVYRLWEERRYDNHSMSYLTLRELSSYSYPKEFIMCNSMFIEQLEILKTLGGLDDVRIVFWFDN